MNLIVYEISNAHLTLDGELFYPPSTGNRAPNGHTKEKQSNFTFLLMTACTIAQILRTSICRLGNNKFYLETVIFCYFSEIKHEQSFLNSMLSFSLFCSLRVNFLYLFWLFRIKSRNLTTFNKTSSSEPLVHVRVH